MTPLALALRFHETYERLAPSFGYETRTDTRAFDPESKNGRLMVAVCAELLSLMSANEVPLTVPHFHGLDTPERVCFYEQEFYVLSNFSAFAVEFNGHLFQTAEHAYHFQKFPNSGTVRNGIIFAASAHSAFKTAEDFKTERRADWDLVKVDIMRDILRAKVDQHEYVRRKLLETGERELIENSWRDDFWGWGPNRTGRNMLGRLWMEVRSELKTRNSSSVSLDRQMADRPPYPKEKP